MGKKVKITAAEKARRLETSMKAGGSTKAEIFEALETLDKRPLEPLQSWATKRVLHAPDKMKHSIEPVWTTTLQIDEGLDQKDLTAMLEAFIESKSDPKVKDIYLDLGFNGVDVGCHHCDAEQYMSYTISVYAQVETEMPNDEYGKAIKEYEKSVRAQARFKQSLAEYKAELQAWKNRVAERKKLYKSKKVTKEKS